MPDDETPEVDAPTDASPDYDTPPAQAKEGARRNRSADDGLGDAGKAALEAERKARRDADRQLKAMQSELDQLRQKSMTDTERAIAEAKAEGRKAALAEANDRLVRAELRAAAAGKLADPGDAAYLLGDLSDFVDEAGDVNTKAIAKAIDALVEQKPYLAPRKAEVGPLPGGGATPSNGVSMDDWIRREATSRGRR